MLPIKTILLAGVGALGYYLYNRMSEEQKNKIVRGVKDQLNRAVDQLMPTNSRAAFETKADTMPQSRFGEGDSYTG
jgi:hypothetical protein